MVTWEARLIKMKPCYTQTQTDRQTDTHTHTETFYYFEKEARLTKRQSYRTGSHIGRTTQSGVQTFDVTGNAQVFQRCSVDSTEISSIDLLFICTKTMCSISVLRLECSTYWIGVVVYIILFVHNSCLTYCWRSKSNCWRNSLPISCACRKGEEKHQMRILEIHKQFYRKVRSTPKKIRCTSQVVWLLLSSYFESEEGRKITKYCEHMRVFP